MRPFTDEEYNKYPKVIMTSDARWDNTSIDCTISNRDDWFANIEFSLGPYESNFDDFGSYLHCTGRDPLAIHTDINVNFIAHSSATTEVQLKVLHPSKKDFEALRPHFLFADPKTIANTYDHTTQWARRLPNHGPSLRDTYKSPFPMFSVRRRNEAVATDTIESNVLGFGGVACAQAFIGHRSGVIDVYPMTSKDQFVTSGIQEFQTSHRWTKKMADVTLKLVY
jgi:hypothetical protein